MVQRNLTPGGDKNGADINLALDALEMAFTHSHINTFVIVSGDSDFMALVEKLKQYDRKVLVVGGRAFTSHILQKNCHEFIAYENLIGRRAGAARPRRRRRRRSPARVTLVRRALKVLADREVSPQLGVLKSTLLQLDPTFSEREYGAEHVPRPGAAPGARRLRRAQGHRSQHLRRAARRHGRRAARRARRRRATERRPSRRRERRRGGGGRDAECSRRSTTPRPRAAAAAAACREHDCGFSACLRRQPPPPARRRRSTRPCHRSSKRRAGLRRPAAHLASKQADGYRLIEDVFQRVGLGHPLAALPAPGEAVLRTADESFDERRYGFSGLVEALRFAQREGLFRLDRDRQGVLRVYPGAQLQRMRAGGCRRPPAATRRRSRPQPSRAARAAPQAGDLVDAVDGARRRGGRRRPAGEREVEAVIEAGGGPGRRHRKPRRRNAEVEVARAPRRRSTTQEGGRRSAARKAAAPAKPQGARRRAPRGWRSRPTARPKSGSNGP